MTPKKIRAVIIEDELYDRLLIEKILKENYSDLIDVVAVVSEEEEAIKAIHEKNPGLLFMDIELNGDRNGAFNILDKVEKEMKIIFVTAKGDQDNLLKAIKLSCIDYLIKPTKVTDFKAPIQKAFKEINESPKNFMYNIDTLKHNAEIQNIKEAKISLQEGFSYRPVFIKDIIRCEAQGNYTQFYFVDETNSLINGNLKSFEERLTGLGFCRINKFDLINLSQLKSFSRKNTSWEIIMSDDKTLYISPSRKQQFLMQYNNMHMIY